MKPELRPDEIPTRLAPMTDEDTAGTIAAMNPSVSLAQAELVIALLRRNGWLSPADKPEHEERIRAKVAADLRRAAAGRRHYADHAATPGDAVEFRTEAAVYETAAKAAINPREVMWGLLPAEMWTDADRPTRGDA